MQLAAAADLEPRELVLRDCTLVPGSALKPDGTGVMHALFQPQRETNLRIRLDEYLRFEQGRVLLDADVVPRAPTRGPIPSGAR